MPTIKMVRKTHHKISQGTVHTVPSDLKDMLTSSKKAMATWEDITPLARNEWICFILDAKKEETRKHRIQKTQNKLTLGERRPCCWAGCNHR